MDSNTINATTIDEFTVQELGDDHLQQASSLKAAYSVHNSNNFLERTGTNDGVPASTIDHQNIANSSAIFYEEPDEESRSISTEKVVTMNNNSKRTRHESDDDDFFGSSSELSDDEYESQVDNKEYQPKHTKKPKLENSKEEEEMSTEKKLGLHGGKPSRGSKDELWKWKYNLLKEYKALFGTTRVRRKNGPLEQMKMLMKWIDFQRASYKKGNVPKWRIKLLDDLGFEWTVPDNGGSIGAAKKIAKDPQKQWMKRYNELKKFKEEFGHLKIKRGPLDSWVNRQRNKIKDGLLTKKQVLMLGDLGLEISGTKDELIQLQRT